MVHRLSPAKNISLLYGVPSNLEVGREQHKMLADKLKNNEVFMFKSQNRGYLALRDGVGMYRGAYLNTLYRSKPKHAIVVTKV